MLIPQELQLSRPLLYVLGLNTNTFRAVAPHTHCVHLRAPPAYC